MADRETRQADLFIVIGSSLEVSPANYFPGIAKANGAYLVIINRDATVMDNEADLVIRESAGEVLTQVANQLQ
jgi:NAD-dependent deacetylase